MSFPNISSSSLKGLIKLVEKRDALQAELSKIDSQISSAFGGKAAKVIAQASKAQEVPRGKRGALKESILACLKAAGKPGVSVKELSSKLGVKNQNLHVWFHTTGKKVKGLKKAGVGRWALVA